jgi:PAS domain S-box-containing protein
MQERIRAEVAEEANQQLTQEIEQRIAVESALKGTTARLRSIVESGEDFIIWTAGDDHQVTSANANFDQWLSLSGDGADNDNRSSTLKSQVLSSVELNGFDLKDRFSRALAGKPQRFEWAISRDEIDGGRRWLQLFLNPIDSVGGKGEISAIAYDITERKRIDRRIRDALKEKEILLQEVHHRVKNNLQIIHSILNLQKKFVDDEKTITGLEEIQNRVSTMSIIHETLYQNTDVSRIGFPSYITRIAGNIIQSYRSETQVELVTELEDIEAPLDQAIPCGLILNEWVSNAMKYAFVGRSKGTITVKLGVQDFPEKENEEEVYIEVKDDGVGLPDGFDWSGRDSLGLYLVQALSEQLDAELTAESDEGTRFLIKFRRPKNLFDG